VTEFVDWTVAVRVKFVPDGTLTLEVVRVKVVGTGPPPPPPAPPLLPQLRTKNNRPAIPRAPAKRRLFRLADSDRSRITSPSANANIHEPGGQIPSHRRRRVPIKVVEGLEDGGRVPMDSIVLAAVPLETLKGGGGIKEQVTFAN